MTEQKKVKKYVWNVAKPSLKLGKKIILKGGEVDPSKMSKEQFDAYLKKGSIIEAKPQEKKVLDLEPKKSK